MSTPFVGNFPTGLKGENNLNLPSQDGPNSCTPGVTQNSWFGVAETNNTGVYSKSFVSSSTSEFSAAQNSSSLVEDFGNSVPSFSHEKPLLEELGVKPEHIYLKTITVLNPTRPVDRVIMEDADLAGPIAFIGMLGTGLLFQGKLQYGHLFGLLIFGSFGLYLLLNLMSQIKQIDYMRTLSIVGYSMLPLVSLAGLSILVSLRGWSGVICGVAAVVWCAHTSTRFFTASLDMESSKWLISYPVMMYYSIFVLVTIF